MPRKWKMKTRKWVGEHKQKTIVGGVVVVLLACGILFGVYGQYAPMPSSGTPVYATIPNADAAFNESDSWVVGVYIPSCIGAIELEEWATDILYQYWQWDEGGECPYLPMVDEIGTHEYLIIAYHQVDAVPGTYTLNLYNIYEFCENQGFGPGNASLGDRVVIAYSYRAPGCNIYTNYVMGEWWPENGTTSYSIVIPPAADDDCPDDCQGTILPTTTAATTTAAGATLPAMEVVNNTTGLFNLTQLLEGAITMEWLLLIILLIAAVVVAAWVINNRKDKKRSRRRK